MILDKIIIVEVRDRADFDTVMARRAFSHKPTAEGWAKAECQAKRDALRASGEKDEDYIEAIYVHMWTVDFDDR